MQKINVGIIFGGRSAEHEVSLQSAKNVIDAIDKNKYEVTLIGIDKEGNWQLSDINDYLENADNPKTIRLKPSNNQLAIVPGSKHSQLRNIFTREDLPLLDVVFPVMHGTYAEDGTMQGLLKLADIPYVGPDVLGSSVSMDKDVMKRLMRDAGIPNADFLVFQKHQAEQADYQQVVDKLGEPVFIKPANMGSSVGVNKARNKEEFFRYLHHAFEFDNKVVVEEFIKGREIECAVLGNEDPQASVPGEIMAHHEFYSYEAKYLDEKGATLQIPADLPADIAVEVRKLAVKTFKVLACEGLSRVDMFVTEDQKIFVNEINTLPGFTKISMYPKLWENTGISYTALIDRLLTHAIERYQRDRQLKTSNF
jgi:D-alanine-D-alanine ligase